MSEFPTVKIPTKMFITLTTGPCENKITYKTTGDGDAPAKEEGVKPRSVVTQENGLQGVKEAEVEAAVDEDANAANDEAAVEASDSI